jgi:hypothetical protein
MENKYTEFEVVVGVEVALTISSNKPISEKQLIKKLRDQNMKGLEMVETDNKFAYVVSTEPVEVEVDKDGPH